MPRKAKNTNVEEPIDIVEIDYDQQEQDQYPQSPIDEPQIQKKPVSQKRLEALAKGREKARLNRLKKKEDEKAQLKEQLKQELLSQQPLREPSPPKRSQSERQPPPKSESEEEEEESAQRRPKSPKKEKEKKQESAQRKQKEESVRQSERQPKVSKAEEQKKVLQKAKKNIPVFKEEPKPKKEKRVKDFFKPKKVIEVSDSESD